MIQELTAATWSKKIPALLGKAGNEREFTSKGLLV